MFRVKHAARDGRGERCTPFSTCCTCQEPYAHRTGTGAHAARDDADARDPAVSAQKAATCDAWKPRKELSNRPADEAFNTPQIATISIRRFPKQPKLREMRQPTRCRTSRLFVQNGPAACEIACAQPSPLIAGVNDGVNDMQTRAAPAEAARVRS